MLSLSNSWEINKACFLALPIFPSNWFWLWPHFFKHFSQEMQWGGGAKQNMAYASPENYCMARPLGVTQLQRKVVASGGSASPSCALLHVNQRNHLHAQWGFTESPRQRWQVSPDCLLEARHCVDQCDPLTASFKIQSPGRICSRMNSEQSAREAKPLSCGVSLCHQKHLKIRIRNTAKYS